MAKANAISSDSGRDFGIKPGDVVHWYDFVCPFCYVGQHRTAILEEGGLHVVELPFRAHPEIPKEGKYMGPRSGPMYDVLNREAEEAELPLHWPDRLPNTQLALSCAEWVREHAPDSFRDFQSNVFAAHFARQQDIGDQSVLDAYAAAAGVGLTSLHAAIADGSAVMALRKSEHLGTSVGVQGTPAWLVGDRLISGLRPAKDFEALGQSRL